jgi:hypothetical protein
VQVANGKRPVVSSQDLIWFKFQVPITPPANREDSQSTNQPTNRPTKVRQPTNQTKPTYLYCAVFFEPRHSSRESFALLNVVEVAVEDGSVCGGRADAGATGSVQNRRHTVVGRLKKVVCSRARKEDQLERRREKNKKTK